MTYRAAEMMTVAAARALTSEDICFVGIGLPSAACNLARLTHAPKLKLVYESGTIETRPKVLPLSIGDGELCETALTTVSVPEMFQYWLQGGRITVGFLSGAQVDRFGNLNSTVIGAYARPKVRLPGSGAYTAAKFVRMSAAPRSVARSRPSIRIEPPVGSSTPRIMLIVVVFPAPFGPSSPTISWRATSNDTLSTAVCAPYVFRRFDTLRTIIVR